MSEAIDVLRDIDQLRRDLSGYHGQLKAHNDLQRHCDNQRKRIGELEALYAGAKAEIAELKEQTRWMAQTDSRWEAAIRDLEQAKAENAKLRELLRDTLPFIAEEADYCVPNECFMYPACCEDTSDICPAVARIHERARELGVEP